MLEMREIKPREMFLRSPCQLMADPGESLARSPNCNLIFHPLCLAGSSERPILWLQLLMIINAISFLYFKCQICWISPCK